MNTHYYPIKASDHNMILGTLHPHTVQAFTPIIDFFYGYDYGLWDLFRINFQIDLYSKKELLDEPALGTDAVRKIELFLQKYHITVSDQMLQCTDSTTHETCHEILNTTLLEAIQQSNIQKIFFTSMETYKYFCYMINDRFSYKKIQKKGYLNDNCTQLILPNQKKVYGIVLISPSSSGVRALPSQLRRVIPESPWYDIAQRYLKLKHNHINAKGICTELRDQYYKLVFRSVIHA